MSSMRSILSRRQAPPLGSAAVLGSLAGTAPWARATKPKARRSTFFPRTPGSRFFGRPFVGSADRGGVVVLRWRPVSRGGRPGPLGARQLHPPVDRVHRLDGRSRQGDGAISRRRPGHRRAGYENHAWPVQSLARLPVGLRRAIRRRPEPRLGTQAGVRSRVGQTTGGRSARCRFGISATSRQLSISLRIGRDANSSASNASLPRSARAGHSSQSRWARWPAATSKRTRRCATFSAPIPTLTRPRSLAQIESFHGICRKTGKRLLVNECIPGCLDDGRRAEVARFYTRMLCDAGFGWMGWGLREGKAVSMRRDRYDANGLDGQGFHPFFTRDGKLRRGLEFLRQPPAILAPWEPPTRA